MSEGERNAISSRVLRVFFARHGGRLRPVQEIAFAALMDNRDALVMAQTGSGKTEAVLVPVAQRMLESAGDGLPALRALMISPTRSLASDLHRRMAPLFAELGLRLDVATSDHRTLGSKSPDMLIRTPEGLDRDLCVRSAWLASLDDVVVDELHQFLGTSRGTQMAGLLARLGRVAPRHRRLAISATVTDRGGPAGYRLLRDPLVIEDPSESGSTEVVYHHWHGNKDQAPDRFVEALRGLGVRKAIGFVRSRDRAETLSHLLNRGFLRTKCLPHHADLSRRDRRKVEEQFRRDPAGLVIATTTLEVGIDIGSIDTCILFDAPPDRASYLQRLGRAGRRSGIRRVVCVVGLYDRRVDFAKVVLVAGPGVKAPDYRPALSGCLQQILSFSLERGSASRDELASVCREAFGLEPKGLDRLLLQLGEDGWLVRSAESFAPTEKTLLLHRTNHQLHRTFSGAGGTPVYDQTSGQNLGRALVDGRDSILLRGKARKITGVDPRRGGVVTVAAEEGKASFSPRGTSVFEQLAIKYSRFIGNKARVD